MILLEAKNVHYIYQSKYQKVHALKDVSCTFESGKLYAIIGHSGSGKTTLLSMLAGLGMPAGGAVYAGGEPIEKFGVERHRRENVSVIYQAFNLFQTLNILENVMYPMQLSGKSKRAAKEKAASLLKSVGLRETAFRKLPAMLSGGEQQRVAIARALASDAKIILADEPTGNLDTENGRIVIDLLKRLAAEEDYCVIIVTHDPDIAAEANVIYRMTDGHLTQDEGESVC